MITNAERKSVVLMASNRLLASVSASGAVVILEKKYG